MNTSRTVANIVTEILTGHCRLKKKSLYLCNLEEDSFIPNVGKEEETSYNFLGSLEVYNKLRFIAFSMMVFQQTAY